MFFLTLAACSWGATEPDDDGPFGVGPGTGGAGGKSDGGSGGGDTDADDDDPDVDGGASKKDGGATPPPPGTGTALKVAFFADTASGADFKKVLALVKAEKADLAMIQGDLTYDGEKAPQWFTALDSEIGGANKLPFVVAKGNHDSDWNALGAGIKQRMASAGVKTVTGDATTINYSAAVGDVFMVMVGDSETSPPRAQFVEDQLKNDKHPWKICSWHKNQRLLTAGPKNDEMGYAVYEACRKYGALVITGHSHTYSRTKTLVNDTAQTVDSTCSSPFDLCLGAGKHFVADSSLGGHDMRGLTSVAQNPYWGATYSGSFGALFITFGVGGDSTKAEGYFKTISGQVIDPPASSGKTKITITRTP